MRVAFLVLTAAVFFAVPQSLRADGARFNSVDPASGKAGDTIGANGEGIGKGNVAELYLTDGSLDIKVAIVEHTETLIKFTIPAKVKPGRYSLMIKTTGASPKLLEQPVKVEVI